MGHERIGRLPKTHQWRQIVEQIGRLSTSDIEIAEIAGQTIKNVRSRLRSIEQDEGVKAAFKFLVMLSIASRSQNPEKELSSVGIRTPESITPLSLAKELHRWVAANGESLEYRQIAQGAATDAIAIWHNQNKATQARLFEPSDDPYDVWRKAGNGRGFCELARIFFAKFTERYLNYYLEREASSALKSANKRAQFSEQIEDHVDKVSQHAFETAKITQSYSAGWFNKYAAQGIPDEQTIESFLSYAFGKIRDELQRGGVGK
jgi:HEPN domain-containing protein